MRAGEVVSLIGESGSGKSTIGRMILRLSPVTKGSITFKGEDIATFGGHRLKDYYGHVQGVFQDPFSSYNPIYKADRVFKLIKDALLSDARRSRLADASSKPRSRRSRSIRGRFSHKFPHQLSGGQLQRLLVARALLIDIEFLVADEIISMLDASTRIDVLNLLGDLKARGLGILFITHDLSFGNYISDRTVILRQGVIVEMGATAKVFGNPQHAYTRMLLAAVPQLHRKWEDVEAELQAKSDEQAAYARASAALESDALDSVLVELEPEHLVRMAA